jgi:short-subunit dehydrogenase involved in D-alanine esterification of teichoic acids
MNSKKATLTSARFLDKICLITGGTKGIGLATANRFLQEKGTVVICSSKQESVNNALKSFDPPLIGKNIHAF